MKNYTDEKNVLIIISLLKSFGINKVIASPGTTNVALVASMQSDSYFEMYSAVDERSAAYMACGLSAETNQPVVITCTGATASRNYLPGLTEAYYRKIPILAITASQPINRIGHHIAQVIDRTLMPKDTIKASFELPIVSNEDDFWECEIKVNMAINELFRAGGGPVHLNLPTVYSTNFETKNLPKVRTIKRIFPYSEFPDISADKIAVLIGGHKKWTKGEIEAIDNFCNNNNAAVFSEHSSNYRGKYWFSSGILTCQNNNSIKDLVPDLVIDIGEINGETFNGKIVKNKVWRVSPDGEIRDRYRKLEFVFQMSEKNFFNNYCNNYKEKKDNTYFSKLKELSDNLHKKVPEIPFSNVWIAYNMSKNIPQNSVIHFGILHSLRSWNLFQIPSTVLSDANSGGYGIDGCVSSLVGASLANPNKLYFGIIGDLAFFYDLNCIGNRHVGNNIRILLVNNGKGTEFRNFHNKAFQHGYKADDYIAAGGHFGNKSKYVVKDYVENFGFKYLTASSKSDFDRICDEFICSDISDKPIVLEAFTDNASENEAIYKMTFIESNLISDAKSAVKGILGKKGSKLLKKVIK